MLQPGQLFPLCALDTVPVRLAGSPLSELESLSSCGDKSPGRGAEGRLPGIPTATAWPGSWERLWHGWQPPASCSSWGCLWGPGPAWGCPDGHVCSAVAPPGPRPPPTPTPPGALGSSGCPACSPPSTSPSSKEGLHSAHRFQAVPFNIELVNLDRAFHPASGRFLCAVPSVYFLSLNVHTWNYKETYLHIMCSGRAAAMPYTQLESAVSCRPRACCCPWQPETPSGCACSSRNAKTPSTVSMATSVSPSAATWSSRPQSSSPPQSPAPHGSPALDATPRDLTLEAGELRQFSLRCLSTNCVQ
ncbi:complement C1q tumor necrosis factor-related protein 8 [Callorhinus ursinus]|uniref:complement C1q tumor necrosis factor-related protein 8 n=1 Tax=Callorhinus ursinus TaxID=34884 RepID=UPI003CCFF9FB